MDKDKANDETGEEKVEEYKPYLAARVLWPADIPDDMLEVTFHLFPMSLSVYSH